MKHDESSRTPAARLLEARQLGGKLMKLRQSIPMTQADAAARAGLSRSTVFRLESGDAGRTLSQVLRYLEALAPELSLTAFLSQPDPVSARAREAARQLAEDCAKPVRRVRISKTASGRALDF
jgi:transcriptional regulator with XRE-family HTH domain